MRARRYAPPRRALTIPSQLYSYPRDPLLKYDAFELWPLDGGALSFLQEQLGSATGRSCLAALLDGRLLAPWRDGDNTIHWWDRPGVGPLRRAIEQHVWVNRLYFLLPLALEFFRSCDARLRDFGRGCSIPG